MEYAFELNQSLANAGATTLAANSGFLTLTYRRRTDEDTQGLFLFYRVKVSPDRVTWSSESEFTEENFLRARRRLCPQAKVTAARFNTRRPAQVLARLPA